MGLHITAHRAGFGPGLTAIARIDDADPALGLGVAVLNLGAGEIHAETCAQETAFLLMSGRASVAVGNHRAEFGRSSLFDESPSALHVSAGTAIRIEAASAVEFTVYSCANRRPFPAAVYQPADTKDEHRGKGQVGGACLRLVRTIFDRSNAPAEAELVLGEVVTLPGRWSSYPPHHHPQPEIYHYRFDQPQGFGFAQHGDQVFKVQARDTVKIVAGCDHAQAAAPGYAMYYAWVIRHLPGHPYSVPEFTAEHRWTMAPDARVWHPQGVKDA